MEWRLSETQLFFLATGVVLPRGRMPSEKLVRWFMRQGVEEQQARELAWAAYMSYYIDGGEYLDITTEQEAAALSTLEEERHKNIRPKWNSEKDSLSAMCSLRKLKKQ